jgi:hypothetical protein
MGEYLDFEPPAKSAARLTSLGNKPLLILSKDASKGATPKPAAGLLIWDREQEG